MVLPLKTRASLKLSVVFRVSASLYVTSFFVVVVAGQMETTLLHKKQDFFD